MFMGSGHVKPGEFDTLARSRRRQQQRLDRERPHQLLHQRPVERARARAVPRVGPHGLSARLDDAADASTPQRDVVKNERRQSVREPARTAWPSVVLGEMLYPEGHPYHWPVIGYMADLTAASYDDVVAFFKKYYAPAQRQPGAWPATSTRSTRGRWSRSGSATSRPARRSCRSPFPASLLTGVQKKTITDRCSCRGSTWRG